MKKIIAILTAVLFTFSLTAFTWSPSSNETATTKTTNTLEIDDATYDLSAKNIQATLTVYGIGSYTDGNTFMLTEKVSEASSYYFFSIFPGTKSTYDSNTKTDAGVWRRTFYFETKELVGLDGYIHPADLEEQITYHTYLTKLGTCGGVIATDKNDKIVGMTKDVKSVFEGLGDDFLLPAKGLYTTDGKTFKTTTDKQEKDYDAFVKSLENTVSLWGTYNWAYGNTFVGDDVAVNKGDSYYMFKLNPRATNSFDMGSNVDAGIWKHDAFTDINYLIGEAGFVDASDLYDDVTYYAYITNTGSCAGVIAVDYHKRIVAVSKLAKMIFALSNEGLQPEKGLYTENGKQFYETLDSSHDDSLKEVEESTTVWGTDMYTGGHNFVAKDLAVESGSSYVFQLQSGTTNTFDPEKEIDAGVWKITTNESFYPLIGDNGYLDPNLLVKNTSYYIYISSHGVCDGVIAVDDNSQIVGLTKYIDSVFANVGEGFVLPEKGLYTADGKTFSKSK